MLSKKKNVHIIITEALITECTEVFMRIAISRTGVNKYWRRIPRFKRLCAAFLIVCSLISLFSSALYIKAIPIALMTLETVSKGYVEKKVIEGAERAIAESKGELLSLITDSNGKVISLKADGATINSLTSRVIENIHSGMKKTGSVKVKVPVGSLISNRAFHGLGPCITVRATPYVAAYATVDSTFTDAGINQTLHRMLLTVSTDVTVVCAGKTLSFSTQTVMTVSEEIIVGGVPDGFI